MIPSWIVLGVVHLIFLCALGIPLVQISNPTSRIIFIATAAPMTVVAQGLLFYFFISRDLSTITNVACRRTSESTTDAASASPLTCCSKELVQLVRAISTITDENAAMSRFLLSSPIAGKELVESFNEPLHSIRTRSNVDDEVESSGGDLGTAQGDSEEDHRSPY